MSNLPTDPSTQNRFDRDTAVRSLDDESFDARIDRGWWVVRGPNGGYIAAILLRALMHTAASPERTPRSLTVHYTAPPQEGEAKITTRLERSGRSLSTLTARLEQGGRLCALALAALSTPRESHEFFHAVMPSVPPPEALEPAPVRIPMNERYEYRFAPEASPMAGSERALTAAWIRPSEPHALDHALLAAYADALPPAVFAQASEQGQFGALPTVDLSVHFRTHPEGVGVGPEDFCLAVFRSRVAHQGYIEEDGEIWSRDGALLAQSRQLAVILGA